MVIGVVLRISATCSTVNVRGYDGFEAGCETCFVSFIPWFYTHFANQSTFFFHRFPRHAARLTWPSPKPFKVVTATRDTWCIARAGRKVSRDTRHATRDTPANDDDRDAGHAREEKFGAEEMGWRGSIVTGAHPKRNIMIIVIGVVNSKTPKPKPRPKQKN